MTTPDRRPKKSTQKKVALLTASLRFAAGNLWCSGMGCTAKLTTRQRRSVQTDAVSQFTMQLHSAVQLPSPYPVLLGAFRRDGAQTQAIAYFRRMKLTEQSPCFLHMPAALLGFAGRISPGGRGTFLGDQEKYPKEGRPADCVPSLRCGQPAVLGYGLHRETHYAPEALRSNRRGESVHEAVALFGATAQPIPCAPRRIQKGN